MFQMRATDEGMEMTPIINLRQYPSSIERRKYERRRNWIDPLEGTERLLRRKIRRADDVRD